MAIVVVAFSVAYFRLPEYHDGITFLALAITAAGGVGGAFYVGKSLSLQLEHQKRLEAFGLIARWNDPTFFYVRAACYEALEVYRTKKDAAAVSDLLKNDKQMAQNARNVLNFLEELAIAVRVGHVDEELSAAAFLGLVIRLYEAFQHWINEHRGAANRQDIWKELEGLYENWKKR